MRTTVLLLAALVAGGCGNDDDSSPDDGVEPTGGSDVVTPPGGDTGEGDDESGGFSVDDDDGGEDESSGDDGEVGPTGWNDDFEATLVGQQPNDPWLDVVARIDDPTVPSPSATVVDTSDPLGDSTRAVQLHDAIGTSQGLMATIDPSTYHRVAASVRIDQFTDAAGGDSWPVAVGLLQDAHTRDLNQSPHAVVSARGDGTWHLSVRNGDADSPTLDVELPTPAIEIGQWYQVQLEVVDATTGELRAEVSDPATGDVLGELMVLASVWDESYAEYDAVAIFDGEYGVEGGTQGGQATLDDVVYAPRP